MTRKPKSPLVKVTVEFTQKDVENVEFLLKKFNSRSKADTLSSALSITKKIIGEVSDGGRIICEKKDGSVVEFVFPELL